MKKTIGLLVLMISLGTTTFASATCQAKEKSELVVYPSVNTVTIEAVYDLDQTTVFTFPSGAIAELQNAKNENLFVDTNKFHAFTRIDPRCRSSKLINAIHYYSTYGLAN